MPRSSTAVFASLTTLLALTACAPSVAITDKTLSTATDAAPRADDGQLSSGKAATLADRITEVLQRENSQRQLDSSTNAAWQIMHGVVAYGNDLLIRVDNSRVEPAVSYMLNGGMVNGFELAAGDTILKSTGRRGVKARLEPGSYVGQGHPDQWLAVFAMCKLPLDTPIQIDNQSFTLEDLARQAQYDVVNNPLDEFSWTLIALTHYFPQESSWEADGGVIVNWEDLLEVELRQDIDSSACGGTHRLAGIVRTLNAHRGPSSAVWNKARRVVDEAIRKAKEYRSTNGSLSSYYFVSPLRTADAAAELASSGHVFEFLALALDESELRERWMVTAGNRLCDLLDATQTVDLDCGALYHALNGLKVYRKRIANN